MATRSGDPVIKVRDLVVDFAARRVLNGVNLDLKRGEILGFVGASGAGKSVLTRTIIGLLPMQAGSIEVLNVEFPIREYLRLSPKLTTEIAISKLEMVGLKPDVYRNYPSELSGGMIKRVALARALALDPEILFLDEPTSGLDPISAAEFDHLLLTLQETLGISVFMVTHDLDSLHRTCDRIAVLSEGKIVEAGNMDVMLASQHPWLKEYFHGERAHTDFQVAIKGRRVTERRA
jgi:phospholipid/cholesterol/gamma-HCH transport system ATP-binding protein